MVDRSGSMQGERIHVRVIGFASAVSGCHDDEDCAWLRPVRKVRSRFVCSTNCPVVLCGGGDCSLAAAAG